jgi:hypothetical protein
MSLLLLIFESLWIFIFQLSRACEHGEDNFPRFDQSFPVSLVNAGENDVLHGLRSLGIQENYGILPTFRNN